jgi:hypothetical protein
VRTGHRNQDVAVLTRMGDRFSTWDVGNGLQSIIPTLLTSGLLGYPFCLPVSRPAGHRRRRQLGGLLAGREPGPEPGLAK